MQQAELRDLRVLSRRVVNTGRSPFKEANILSLETYVKSEDMYCAQVRQRSLQLAFVKLVRTWSCQRPAMYR